MDFDQDVVPITRFAASNGSEWEPNLGFTSDGRGLKVRGMIVDRIAKLGHARNPPPPRLPVNKWSGIMLWTALFGGLGFLELCADWERLADIDSQEPYPNGDSRLDAYWQNCPCGANN